MKMGRELHVPSHWVFYTTRNTPDKKALSVVPADGSCPWLLPAVSVRGSRLRFLSVVPARSPVRVSRPCISEKGKINVSLTPFWIGTRCSLTAIMSQR